MKSILKNSIFVAAALVVASFFTSCGMYNNMVELDEQVTAQWAQVENQYQRRYDLIPNLVATVQAYASHESEVFTQIAEARAKAGGVTQIDESILTDDEKFAQFQKAQDSLGSALQRLLVVTENYPQLQANQNFLALQDQLEGTENRIATERKRFNDAAKTYNVYIRQFPRSMIASSNGFKTRPYFEAAQAAQSAPAVQF